MPDQSSVSDTAHPSRDRVCATVQALLRGAQARGITDEALHAASGVPARTIKSYRVDGKEPSLTNALCLFAALGKEAMNGLLATVAYTGAHPADEADALDPRRLVADLLPHISKIAEAAADGRFDHTEMPACRLAADRMIAALMPLSSAGGQ